MAIEYPIVYYGNQDYLFTPTWSGSSATTYPITNSLLNPPGLEWRSTSKINGEIILTAASSITLKVIVIAFHNISTYTTFDVQGSTDGVSYTSLAALTHIQVASKRKKVNGETEDYNRLISYLVAPTTYSYRYIKIRINATGITDSYYKIGNILIYSSAYTFENAPLKGHRAGYNIAGHDLESYTGYNESIIDFVRWESSCSVVCKETQATTMQSISGCNSIIYDPGVSTVEKYFGKLKINKWTHGHAYKPGAFKSENIDYEFIETI
jgi:hypothetical protein